MKNHPPIYNRAPFPPPCGLQPPPLNLPAWLEVSPSTRWVSHPSQTTRDHFRNVLVLVKLLVPCFLWEVALGEHPENPLEMPWKPMDLQRFFAVETFRWKVKRIHGHKDPPVIGSCRFPWSERFVEKLQLVFLQFIIIQAVWKIGHDEPNFDLASGKIPKMGRLKKMV